MNFRKGDIIKSINYAQNGFKEGDVYLIQSSNNRWYFGKLLKAPSHNEDVGYGNWSLEKRTIKDGDFKLLQEE